MPRILSVLLLALLPALVRADLAQYIDEQTIAAGEADLTKLDPPAAEAWVREVMAASGLSGNAPMAMKPAEVDKAMGAMTTALTELKKTGAKQVYFMTNLEIARYGGFALIVPTASADEAKKVAAVLFSGRADGPTSQPNRGNHAPRTEVIGGNVAVWSNTTGVNYVRNMKPAERPDITAALAATGGSAVKFAVAPPVPVRIMMSQGLPKMIYDQPNQVITNDLQWIAAGAMLPAKPSVNIVAHVENAESAKSVLSIIKKGLAEASGGPPRMTPGLTKLLTPEIQGTDIVLSADGAKLMELAKEAGPMVMAARQQAVQVQAMSNMRQILMGCIMYANENKNAWPADLKAIVKYVPGQVAMVNPAHPEMSPGFVYLKPAHPTNRVGETAVLYESHKEFGRGVSVGFADGHVEFVNDKKRFDQLVAQSALGEDPK